MRTDCCLFHLLSCGAIALPKQDWRPLASVGVLPTSPYAARVKWLGIKQTVKVMANDWGKQGLNRLLSHTPEDSELWSGRPPTCPALASLKAENQKGR